MTCFLTLKDVFSHNGRFIIRNSQTLARPTHQSNPNSPSSVANFQKRKVIVKLCRLRFGHSCLPAHLNRFYLGFSPFCPLHPHSGGSQPYPFCVPPFKYPTELTRKETSTNENSSSLVPHFLSRRF